MNDHLKKGPNYINSLHNVFIAWRFDKEAYTGDVRKMFNQVKIHPDDLVFHRFLWRTSDTEQPRAYQWLRLNFGDKPAPDIAAAAINTLAKASEAKYPEVAKELRTHANVDDIGGSRESEAKCKQVTREIDAILQTGQLRVKALNSNKKNVDQTDEEFTDFLGHKWNIVHGTFTFKKHSITISDGSLLTKRTCLAYLTQLWDPMGLVTPATIEFRIDLQELWSAGYSDGSYSCIPFMVKAFVAPLKKRSIPRLELMECLSLARLYSTCKEALQFAEINDCKCSGSTLRPC